MKPQAYVTKVHSNLDYSLFRINMSITGLITTISVHDVYCIE